MTEPPIGAPGSEHPVCVVVPCYNEEFRLPATKFREFFITHPEITILFVDDGSRDNTIRVVEQLAGQFPSNAFVLPLEHNQGKAEAVRLGLLYALDRLHPSFIGFWDADLATPLESVPRFLAVLAKMPEIDMVFGARVQLLGRQVHRSAVRHYLGRIFATMVSVILRLAIYDSQCGAKMFRVGPFTRSIFMEPFLSRWIFDVEILARYLQLFRRENKTLAGAVYEYPLETWVDVAGSKVHPLDFFVAFWELVKIRSKYLLHNATQTRQ